MIVFLDVDGTYAARGVVPAGHVAAVRAARARGHQVLLCTGRPVSMLPESIVGAGFDGLVASAGAYVEIDGRVVRDERFPADLAARTVQVLDEHGADYILESPTALLAAPGTRDRVLRAFGATGARDDGVRRAVPDFLVSLQTRPEGLPAPFSKVTVLGSRIETAELGAHIGPRVATIEASVPLLSASGGEIYLAHVHKAIGAQIAARELGVDRADAVAVGDGLNDLEVIAWAGTGVAIEGADPQVLAVADRVAPGPQREGLVTLFGELGLLRE
ncbi:HAD family hydrolase [Cellulomonas soli]|uniref:HAD family hydrolase n=1 Tax=Cellulomonas soli TaxID=931535 RepID=UPI003F85A53B